MEIRIKTKETPMTSKPSPLKPLKKESKIIGNKKAPRFPNTVYGLKMNSKIINERIIFLKKK